MPTGAKIKESRFGFDRIQAQLPALLGYVQGCKLPLRSIVYAVHRSYPHSEFPFKRFFFFL